ncbi:(Fe-S)-binding protein [Defluviimonas sp. 20V17]|uniref:Fe-S oxidoreductase n=1 Tax=Allgaiera indica TaxID=765699 RepID=A0AAN4URP3_9RHOB|nr:(Fe-S)-binding protein [Allgaiera indica]KDB01742.1 (Fe-S)-binding protein [Defluviimonas sp. 20V17]GHE02502.1 heterodisulfide reductase [Allgaiera indica]SDX28894.1 Fe-S oxidoreductase [Allgaiera indica]
MKDLAETPPRKIDTQAAIDRFLAACNSHVGAYLDACIHCGQCSQACHFHEATQDPKYTPALKLQPMTRVYKRHKAPLSGIKRMFGLVPPELTAEYLQETEELIFQSCTMCGRCTEVCPMAIDVASVVALSRQAFVAAGLGPADLLQAAENSRDKGSPLGLTPEVLRDRIEWLSDDNEVEIPLDRDKAEVLVTVSSIEMMKYPDSIVAVARLMNAAGLDWTISTKGYEATNFGVLSGRSDIAKTMITRLTDAAESVGAKLLVIPECGHAYGAMRWSGANILGRPLPFEVLHITELVAKLIRDGKLKLKQAAESVTYHDPCQVSRRGGATGAAREILAAYSSDVREMTPSGNHNWCCGGGGGVQAMASAAALRHAVFQIKINQVEATGAKTFVSACANCRLTMDESREVLHWPREVQSLVEVLADRLEG